MKIAIISDMHFGYDYGGELENDSFDNAEEAVREAIAAGADLLLMPGDVFDSRFPRTDVLARAARVLSMPLLKANKGLKLVSCSKELKRISKRTLLRLPTIAIHGTHERRYGANTIEALENAGVLVHLHKEFICLEKDGKRIAIHGLSGIPDRDAGKELQAWNPQPVEGCTNILMLHQSISPFVYSPLEPDMLKLVELPRGFDLIIDGHLHMHGLEKANGTPLLFPGSTVITQFEENEAEGEKGFYLVDIDAPKELKMDFVPLKTSRKFFLLSIVAGPMLREKIESELGGILNKNLAKPPVVKIKITGHATDVIEQELKEIEKKYEDRLVLRLAKELESPELADKVEFLRKIREQKLSAEEIGLQLLDGNLKNLKFENSFDYERIFSMLVDGDVDNTFNVLIGEQKTLGGKYGKEK